MSNTGKTLGQLLPLVWAVVVILIVWQLVITVFRPHVSLLPPPELAAREFWTLFASGELFVHAGTSLARVLSAWCITGAIAIPLGLAMGWSRRMENIIDPFVELFRPISPLAWIPLAILWFGIGEAGKVFVVCVATFFPTLLSTIAGVKRIIRRARRPEQQESRVAYRMQTPHQFDEALERPAVEHQQDERQHEARGLRQQRAAEETQRERVPALARGLQAIGDPAQARAEDHRDGGAVDVDLVGGGAGRALYPLEEGRVELHGAPSADDQSRKLSSARSNARGPSRWVRCPALEMSSNVARGIASAMPRISAGGVT